MAVADNLRGIQNAKVKCLLTVNRTVLTRALGVPTVKIPQDLNLVIVQAVKLVLLNLSVSHSCD
jgi:hypothetical protein